MDATGFEFAPAPAKRTVSHQFDPLNCLHCLEVETSEMKAPLDPYGDEVAHSRSFKRIATANTLIDPEYLRNQSERVKLTKAMAAKGIKVIS